jgi:hypothetical protein
MIQSIERRRNLQAKLLAIRQLIANLACGPSLLFELVRRLPFRIHHDNPPFFYAKKAPVTCAPWTKDPDEEKGRLSGRRQNYCVMLMFDAVALIGRHMLHSLADTHILPISRSGYRDHKSSVA